MKLKVLLNRKYEYSLFYSSESKKRDETFVSLRSITCFSQKKASKDLIIYLGSFFVYLRPVGSRP